MEFTRRYWTAVALAGLVAVWAVMLERTVVLLGAVGIAGWLLVQQYRFVRTAERVLGRLTLEQTLDRRRLAADETTGGTLSAEATRPVPLTTTVELAPPVGGDVPSVTCALDPGETATSERFTATWPVAGTFEFGRPRVTFRDPLGLFSVTTRAGPTPTVTVEAPAPRNIHIGQAGDRVRAGFGEHETDATGAGFTPAEVREYLSGDSFRRIDWKATARLNEPHVREFESETDIETVLLVDRRASMGDGEAGRRKLDFAREVALSLLKRTQADKDPMQVRLVGDEGATAQYNLGTNEARYRAAAATLRGVEPTTRGSDIAGTNRTAATRAQQVADHLDGETQFERRLRPFFGTTASYVRRVTERPLFASVQTTGTQRSGLVRTLIVTDDSHRTELLEAVKLARRENGQVAVFLTPSVLYGPMQLDDVEAAYREYADFEAFRRELASLPRVDAFEVGPSDRLHTVLAAGDREAVRR